MRFTITSEATGRSIVLRDQRNENEIGVWLLEDGVSGWFGTPAPREDPVSRLMSDGDYLPDALTQGSRIVTLHGYAAFGTTIECAAFVDRINSFMCQRVTVICDDAHGRRMASGYISDDPAPALYSDEVSLRFTLIITCPDPAKYGEPHRFTPSGGWVMVVNEGNVGTYPIIHVDGHVTRLMLALGERQVNWVGDADGLDIDFRDMQPSSGAIVLDNAFAIPPGRSALAVTSDGSVTVTVKSAWR